MKHILEYWMLKTAIIKRYIVFKTRFDRHTNVPCFYKDYLKSLKPSIVIYRIV